MSETSTEALPPCPHCGDAPREDHLHPPIPDRRFDWGIWCVCREDGASVSYGATPELARMRWAEYVEDTAEQARIDAGPDA